jgi:hypothetical protein
MIAKFVFAVGTVAWFIMSAYTAIPVILGYHTFELSTAGGIALMATAIVTPFAFIKYDQHGKQATSRTETPPGGQKTKR